MTNSGTIRMSNEAIKLFQRKYFEYQAKHQDRKITFVEFTRIWAFEKGEKPLTPIVSITRASDLISKTELAQPI